MKKNWLGPPPANPSDIARLVSSLGVSKIVARVLVGRGKSDPDEASRFLNPDIAQLTCPRSLLGADAAIDRILHAIRSRKKILLFGDFDVDGVTGTSIALRALSRLGADVEFFLPKRLVHGYGLSKAALAEVMSRNPDMLITVDCGIRSVEEIAELKRNGVDTVVTDHHAPGPDLPPAFAIVNPKQEGCEYPDKQLAGCGVVFQLLRGIVNEFEHEIDIHRDLDLVALGTVADVVPLDGENRTLVAEGLRVMNRREKVGMMSLIQVSGVEDRVESWHLAYLFGPRINAAGRLGDAGDAVRLLTASDTVLANELARRLDSENLKRQEISSTTLKQALDAIERGVAGPNPDGIVLASNAWHPGVIGIVSAKLVEKFYRPSALIAMDGDHGRGSVRSIRGVDICSVLDDCRDILVQYGGHEMAAGLTIERCRIAEFRERFSHGVSRRLNEENSWPRLRIDEEIRAQDVDLDLAADLERLGPFGFGNAQPRFVIRGVRPAHPPRVVGKGHLKMSLSTDDGHLLDCIGFELGEWVDRGFPSGAIDLVGHVAVNEWNERRSAQYQILDLRESVS